MINIDSVFTLYYFSMKSIKPPSPEERGASILSVQLSVKFSFETVLIVYHYKKIKDQITGYQLPSELF